MASTAPSSTSHRDMDVAQRRFRGAAAGAANEWVDFLVVDEVRRRLGDVPEIDPPQR